MTTEVQVSRNRMHVSYLRTVVSRIARAAGMTRKDGQGIEEAVAQVCLRSFAAGGDDSQSPITVRLVAGDSRVTAEMFHASPEAASSWACEFSAERSRTLDEIRGLADRVELLREGDSCTVRIEKYSSDVGSPASKSPAYLAPAGSANLQR